MSQCHVPITADSKKWTAIAALLCALLAGAAFPLDRAVAECVSQMALDPTPLALSLVCDLGHGVTLGLAFLIFLVLYHDQRLAVSGLLGAGMAGLGAVALKHFIDRPRPGGGDLSFPSGHTATACGAAVVLAHRFPRLRYVFYLAAAGVGAGRILTESHFLSDVLAGAVLGLAGGTAGLLIGQRVADRAPRRWARVGGTCLLVALAVYAVTGRDVPEDLVAVAGPAALVAMLCRASVLVEPHVENLAEAAE